MSLRNIIIGSTWSPDHLTSDFTSINIDPLDINFWQLLTRSDLNQMGFVNVPCIRCDTDYYY